MWAEQVVCFDPRLTREDYLQTSAFSNLVVMEWEEHPYALRKAIRREAMSKMVRETAG